MINRYEVFIEDQLLDIDPKQIIAATFQASAIASGDLASRKVSFTNQIQVPPTNNNIGIFEHANLINAGSTFPFLRKKLRINANGLEIFRGVPMLKSFQSTFSLNLFSLPKDLEIAVGDQVLSDLDFGDSPITWDATFIDSRRNSLSGLVAPVVNYGQIDETLANGTIGNFYLPSVSYKDIIATIISNAGYTLAGDFNDNDDFFNRMAMTYSRPTWIGTTTFQINEILSDTILQKDLLKDLLIKFNAFFKITGLTVEVITMEAILADTAGAENWTNKRVPNKKPSNDYTWANWTQQNWFRYPQDAPTGYISDAAQNPTVTDSYLSVANENIGITRDVYTSLTGAIASIVTNWKVATVTYSNECYNQPVYTSLPASYTFDNEPIPTLILIRDPNAFEAPSIIYDGNVRADYKIGYHTYTGLGVADGGPGLRWGTDNVSLRPGLLNIYYPGIQRILTAGTYKTIREYTLTDIDIKNLDVLKMVFDENDYFLISKVIDYVSGRNTKAELLKMTV